MYGRYFINPECWQHTPLSMSSTEATRQRKSQQTESPHPTFSPTNTRARQARQPRPRPRPGPVPRPRTASLSNAKKTASGRNWVIQTLEHRIGEHLQPRRTGFHPSGRRRHHHHPKRAPARRPSAKTYRHRTTPQPAGTCPAARNNPAARETMGEKTETERVEAGLTWGGSTAGRGERWTHSPGDEEKESREPSGGCGGRWRWAGEMISCGVVGFGFGFVAPCPGPGLDCFGGVGRSRSRGTRREGQSPEPGAVSFRSRLMTRNAGRGSRGAKPPSPRDVTAVGGRAWTRAVACRVPPAFTRHNYLRTTPWLFFFLSLFFLFIPPLLGQRACFACELRYAGEGMPFPAAAAADIHTSVQLLTISPCHLFAGARHVSGDHCCPCLEDGCK